MAGIVASTLRRKAFHKKATVDNRAQVYEAHVSQSPESHGSPSSPTFKARWASNARAPKGAKLCHEDFWPSCVNPSESSIQNVEFESFDTLVPKANSWLQENLYVHLIKCETLEKKVSTVDEVTSDHCMFIPKNHQAIYVKGLRLWFVHVSGSRKAALQNMAPTEIGYMNVIPKCIDASGKYPIYENLPDTYAAINAYLSDSPLEGKIVTIETVPLKLPKKHWRTAQINPDQTFFADEYLRHVLYITRIYFRYGETEAELIEVRLARKFRRESNEDPHRRLVFPMESDFRGKINSAIHSPESETGFVGFYCLIGGYLQLVNQIRESGFGSRNVHTGVNFIEKVESCPMIRFVRVTYVRPTFDAATLAASVAAAAAAAAGTTSGPANGMATIVGSSAAEYHSAIYSPPSGFNYRTFLPAPVKVGMCSGSPVYETMTSTCDRFKIWLRCVERRIIGVETFYHPLKLIWHKQDGCETTVMTGEWTAAHRNDKQHKRRRVLVHVVRVFLDGDYNEPPPHMVPPTPMVEEINDCRCVIM